MTELMMQKYKTLLVIALLALPVVAFAQTGATYENPLDIDSVDKLATVFLEAMQASIVTLAIIFIVIGGLLYIFSAGNEGRMNTAKGAFTAALVGLAIAIAAPSFLREIYKILGGDPESEVVSKAPTFAQITAQTLEFLLGVAGTLAIIAMIIGGLMYLTAGGNESQVDSGKKMFRAAIIGILMVFVSMIIVRQVALFFDPNAAGTAAPAPVVGDPGSPTGTTDPGIEAGAPATAPAADETTFPVDDDPFAGDEFNGG